MPLTVLSVAHPLAPVGPDAVGGAEQVLFALDRALAEAGHRSIVVACEGSQVAGRLYPVPRMAPPFDEGSRSAVREHTRRAMRAALDEHRIDLVHLHAVEFDQLLPTAGVRTLVTLHLPRAFYRSGAFATRRRDTWFNCMSALQHRDYRDLGNWLLPAIENGVAVPALTPVCARGDYALVLSRICEEKGIHLAIHAARAAGVQLIIAGQVFGYAAHLQYFRQQIAPQLSTRCRFIGPAAGELKRRLLARARCLLVPSLVAETSSLASREALACGTPVIAFDHGALRQLVLPGRTGFLVRDVDQMAHAIHAAVRIEPGNCVAVARRCCSLARMRRAYLSAYLSLASPLRKPACDFA